MKTIKNEEIINAQMKTISDLQDKINLLKFDIGKKLVQITHLKNMNKRRKKDHFKSNS